MSGDTREHHDVLHGDLTRRVVLLTPDWTTVLDASIACRYQLRLGREDILGGTTSVFDPTDDRVAPAREQLHRTGSFVGRLRLVPKDGAPFEAAVTIVRGAAAGLEVGGDKHLAVVEYTVESQVPPGLEEQWSRTPVHHSPDVVALYEADGTLRYISPSVVDVLGWSPEEMTGHVTISLVHPDDVEAMIESMLAASDVRGPSEPIVFRVLHKDGRWRHLEVLLKDLSDDPDVGGSTVHFRDITARVEALGESFFHGLNALDGSSVGIANVATDGRVVRFNDRFREILGRPRDELAGLATLSEVVHPDDRDGHHAELLQVAAGGGAAASQWRYLRADGAVAWVASRVQRPVGASELLDVLVVTVEDITARKEAEAAWDRLTPREQEVLALVVRGRSNREIAEELYMSVHTVKHHVQGVLRTLKVADRAQAAHRVAALHTSPPGSGPTAP